MQIVVPEDFINQVKTYNISSEYVIVKPNWVSNKVGEYTEPEILDWLLEAFPQQKKIVIESYTSWRGLQFEEDEVNKGQGATLEGGKKHWDFYNKQDKYFLQTTGNEKVLQKHKAEYINITDEYWSKKCVESETIQSIITQKGKYVTCTELYDYVPKKLFDIRESATLISLSKIKVEEDIPVIGISMSTKNLFGLIPHPSRWIPYHGKSHTLIPGVIKDINSIYTSLFENNLWIAEGVKTLIKDYCGTKQQTIKNKKLLFIGRNAKDVDSEACAAMGIDPKQVPHLQI